MDKVDLSILPEWQQETAWAPLQAWYNKNSDETPDSMIYKEAMANQFMFFRDVMSTGIFYEKVKSLEAISEHISKSVKLPVYKAVLNDGTTIIARYNFHDWKVSVWCNKELVFPLSLLCKSGEKKINSVYCEGFKDEWVLDSYENNKMEFTVELRPGENHMWTFLFLLNEQLK